MIRRVFLLSLVSVLLVYTLWNFYVHALAYDPLKDITVKTEKGRGADAKTIAAYSPAWTPDIHEKNLFSPARTYREPKPVSVALPPPEPPRKPDFVLKGIILDSFGDYVAYIEIDKAKPAPFRKGDKNDLIEMTDITGRQAVLQWNNEKITLSLDKVKMIANPKAQR